MARKIKVRLLINDPLLGGAQMIAADIVRSLPRENFDASLWYLYGDGTQEDTSCTIHQRFPRKELNASDLHVRGFVSGVFLLARRLRQEQVDVLHCHLPVSIIVGSLAAFFSLRTRVIAHYHNTNTFNSWKINTLLYLVRLRIDLNVCYSESVERELFGSVHVVSLPVTAVPHHSCTLLNFVDTKFIDAAIANSDRDALRATLSIDPDSFVVFMGARMLAWKGQGVLISAFNELYKSGLSKARLLLAGDGVDRPDLEGLVHNLNLTDRVIFLGERPDVLCLLGASDVVASPYIYPVNAPTKDAVGISTLEAMAAGLPVVASDYPSAHLYIEDGKNGILVPPGDATSLGSALRGLAINPARRKEIGNNAKEIIETRFSLEQAVQVYTMIYTKLTRT